MSHVVTIKAKCKDQQAIEQACDKLGLECKHDEVVKLYAGQFRGTSIRLPNWSYPICIDEETGEINYDNYNGSWGDIAELHKFRQRYSLEAAGNAARSQGYRVLGEQDIDGGGVKLTIQVGDDADVDGNVGGGAAID